MAPLSRLAVLVLAAFLLVPRAARAQTEGETRSGMAALKARFPAAAQKPAEPAADPAKLRASATIIDKAGLPMSELIDASDKGMGWTPKNIADLGPAITAASRAVEKLQNENPSAVGATFYGGGTMVNLDESIKWATGLWGGSDLKRGCVSHQGVTLAAVRPVLKDSSLDVRAVFVMRKVGPHHAVLVFPKGSDWKKTAVVLDGWIHQESAPNRMTYLFKDWYGFTSWGVDLE
jgi:hypothetical protein